MEIIKKDLGSFHLHLIPTNKFKTITIKVIFHSPIEKNRITKRNILLDILLQSSNKYKSKRELSIEAEELYSAEIYTNNQSFGNYMISSFELQVLNDKYTEEGNTLKAIEFFSEIIFNPDCSNKKFRKEKLDIVKKNTKIALESIKEEPSNYAMIRMYEEFDKNSNISLRMMGYLEDIDNINEEDIYLEYQNMIQNDLVDIFVLGEFDSKEMLSTIKKYFKFKLLKKDKGPYQLDSRKIRRNIKFIKEEVNNNQSRLVVGCPFKKLTKKEENYVLPLVNLILGGGVESRLFKEVRERYSLCYSIHSFSNRLDHLLVITSGIDKNNYPKVINLISDILGDLKKGKITNKEIEVALECFISSLEEIEEKEERLIFEYFFEDILDIPNIKLRKEEIKKVNKKDIIGVFKKIKIDTIFLLEGGENETD